ncbi:MAG: hypothetical protein RR574_12275, partial [Comamonas sp.]
MSAAFFAFAGLFQASPWSHAWLAGALAAPQPSWNTINSIACCAWFTRTKGNSLLVLAPDRP